ncbi:MAG: tRNA (N6-threonylcarbamoyladenosine(37)-N6)-methyltransferase TrmO [Nannocystaceae bacterium]
MSKPNGLSMKRRKPIQNHTAEHAEAHTQAITLRPIGVVHSPYTERFGTPRQPPITQQVLGDEAKPGFIELHPGHNYDQALRDLDGFERIWVVFVFHLNHGWNPMVRPPRGPGHKQGLFATRAPHRPNPIGLSCLELDRIEGRSVYVRGLDILDKTPVLDIKPYIPYADAFPQARAGWLTGLPQHEADQYDD